MRMTKEDEGGSDVKADAPAGSEQLSHNLLGQRLGRKGRDTRERILAATEKLLAGPLDTPISLSAVAREASLGMTTLYLYFADLTELLLAVLDPIIASAEDSYIAHLRTRWADEALDEQCLRFVQSYYSFWVEHSRILHMRNALADGGDERMRRNRIEMSQPVVELLFRQMDGEHLYQVSPARAMATVLMTGVERVITVTTDNYYSNLTADEQHARSVMEAEARVIELGIRDVRAKARGGHD